MHPKPDRFSASRDYVISAQHGTLTRFFFGWLTPINFCKHCAQPVTDMTTQTSMVEYYARRASEYERIYHKPERQADLQCLRAIMQHTFADRRVLEIACGTGYWTEIIAHTAASVLATDINEEVLAVARAKPIPAGKAVFRRDDVYALAPMPEKFDAGLAAFWWSHIPRARWRGFLESFHRHFAPGARLVFIDNVYVAGSSTPLARTDAEGNTYQTRRLDDGTAHDVLKNFPTPEELRRAVESLATDIHIECLAYFWVLSYVPKLTG